MNTKHNVQSSKMKLLNEIGNENLYFTTGMVATCNTANNKLE